MSDQGELSGCQRSDVNEEGCFAFDEKAENMKEAERNQMKILNEDLEDFISKYHRLKTSNKALVKEIEALQQIQTLDVGSIYKEEMKRFSQEVGQLQSANAELKFVKDNLECKFHFMQKKLEETKEEKKQLEEEVRISRRERDDAVLKQKTLSCTIETQKQKGKQQIKVHEAEVERMRILYQKSFEKASSLSDFSDSIEKIKKQYYLDIERLRSDHTNMVDDLRKQLKTAKLEIWKLQAHSSEKKLETENEGLKEKIDILERDIKTLREPRQREDVEYEDQIKRLKEELDATKQKLKDLEKCQDLSVNKLSLENEIAEYKSLLEQQEVSSFCEINTQEEVISKSRSSSLSKKRSRRRSPDASCSSTSETTRSFSPAREEQTNLKETNVEDESPREAGKKGSDEHNEDGDVIEQPEDSDVDDNMNVDHTMHQEDEENSSEKVKNKDYGTTESQNKRRRRR